MKGFKYKLRFVMSDGNEKTIRLSRACQILRLCIGTCVFTFFALHNMFTLPGTTLAIRGLQMGSLGGSWFANYLCWSRGVVHHGSS